MSKEHLTNQYGRRNNTLRISLTDRCNFRCVYCMPPEGLPVTDKRRFLTIDEIERFVRMVGQLGHLLKAGESDETLIEEIRNGYGTNRGGASLRMSRFGREKLPFVDPLRTRTFGALEGK